MALRSKLARQLEEREGKPITDLLIERYAKIGRQKEVAENLGVDQATLSLWILKLGLEARTVLVRRDQDQSPN